MTAKQEGSPAPLKADPDKEPAREGGRDGKGAEDVAELEGAGDALFFLRVSREMRTDAMRRGEGVSAGSLPVRLPGLREPCLP